jgi:hypothetical protein
VSGYEASTIYGKRRAERLEPWLDPAGDLARLCDAVGIMYQEMLELAEEQGEDGEAPIPQGTNLIRNSGFEYGSKGWANHGNFPTFGATFVRSTEQHFAGKASLAVTTDGKHTLEGVEYAIPGTFLSGVTYNASIYYRQGKVAGLPLQLTLGTPADNEVLTGQTTGAAWERAQVNWKPKANHEGVTLAVQSEIAEKQSFYLDAVMVIVGSVAIPYEETEREYVPAYGALLDPELCPAKALPYLAQFVGVTIPAGTPEAEARALVLAESGLERGTTQSIETAIERVLGAEPFMLQERTNAKGEANAYAFNVIVGTGKKTKALEEAIAAVKPGGIISTVIEGTGMWLQATKKWSEAVAGKTWATIKEGEF